MISFMMNTFSKKTLKFLFLESNKAIELFIGNSLFYNFDENISISEVMENLLLITIVCL